MIDVNFSNQAKKFLKSLLPKHTRQITSKILELQDDPYPNDSRPLKYAPSRYYRVDVGE